MADQVQCIRVKLRPGTTDRVVEFLRGLADRPAEVRASLALEGASVEAFLERTDRGPDRGDLGEHRGSRTGRRPGPARPAG